MSTADDSFQAVALGSSACAAKWTYVNEGKRYLVCAYAGDDSRRPPLRGKVVIRLLKVAVNEAEPAGELISHDELALGLEGTCDALSNELLFTEKIISRLFGERYIARGKEVVVVSKSFLQQLSENISCRRPAGRREKSDIYNKSKSSGESGKYFAILEEDVSTLRSDSGNIAYVSTEIKVKCGLQSTSPFIYRHMDERRFKLKIGKYAISQIYKSRTSSSLGENPEEKRQAQECEWGKFAGISDYSPQDICSRTRTRVSRALESLFINPQNNLRILCNNKVLHSCDVNYNDNGLSIAEVFTELEAAPLSSQKRIYFDIINKVLCFEPIAELLQVLQIDPLDIEGVDVLYSRLVHLAANGEDSSVFGLNSDDLNKVIDNGVFCGTFSQLVNAIIACSSGSGANDDVSGDFSGDPVAGHLRRLRSLQLDPSMADGEAELRYREACLWANALDAELCIAFINMFLLSLLARDASIIISIGNRRAIYCENCTDSTTIDAIQSIDIEEMQTGNHDGCIQIHYDNGLHVLYSCRVRLIDLSPKPSSKIKKKIENESHICSVYMANC